MRRIKSKLSAIVFYTVITVICLVFPNIAFALQSGDFTYTVNATNTVTINAYTCPGGPAVIPPTINGMPVVGIGDYAFAGCAGLTSVTISNSVTSIGYYAFSDCRALTSIVADADNTVYSSQNGVLYNKDKTVLIQYPCGKSGGFTIPDSVTSIGGKAFAGCNTLASVTIPDSVISIGNGAFYSCFGLTSVTIGSGVTSIGYPAFYDCSSLTSVTIPDSVTSIENGVCWLQRFDQRDHRQ